MTSGSATAGRRLPDWLYLLPLAALVLLAIWLLVAPAFRPDAPTNAEWQSAADHVRPQFQKGDVIRLEPPWLTAGRVFFADLDGGKREPFRILDLHDPVDPAFLYRFKRLWLVTSVEAQDDWQERVPEDLELLEESRLEGVTVLLFAIPQGRLSWQMLESLPEAQVVRQGPEGPVRCKWRGNAHRCQVKGAMDVEQKLRRVAGGARQCVNVNTGPDGRPVTLAFPGLSGPGTLLVRVANTIEAARAKDGGEVDATISLGGTVVGSIHLARRSYTLEELAVPLVDGGEKELVIELRATDDRKREICLDGYVISDPGSG